MINTLKVRDDHAPIYFEAANEGGSEFSLCEGSEPSWLTQGQTFGIKELRSRIEPWLTQLKEEIDQMDAGLGALKACAPNTDIGGFRLIENPFFLKLRLRLVFNPDDVGLVTGMYLPLDYWKLLENDPGIMGPKDGLTIKLERVRKSIDNLSGVVKQSANAVIKAQSAEDNND